MATATVDLIENVAAREERGKLVSLTRVALISGVTGTTADGAIAEMLAATGLPASGSSITIGATTLYVIGRDASISDDRQNAKVTLTYGLPTNEESGGSETTNVIRRRGRVAVQQKTTSDDRNGNTIVLSATGLADQGAEWQVFTPVSEPVIETVESTANPDGLAKQWIGRVNSAPWRDEPAGSWMVSEASYEELDTLSTPPKWRFTWAFMFNEDLWLPAAWMIDPATGKPPTPDQQIANETIKKIPYYYQIDFNSKFA